MSNGNLSVEALRFVDDLAALLLPWSMPRNAARLYGYLMLRTVPVTLDQIAEDLEISKSNACTAAKLLEQFGNARKLGERGSKRVFYSISDDFAGPLRQQAALLGTIAKHMERSGSKVAAGPAAERMKALTGFYDTMRNAMDKVISGQEASLAA